MSVCTGGWVSVSRGGTGVFAMREMSTTAKLTHTTSSRKGHAVPAANRNAPSGGPANWFATRYPACRRALPTPRSAGFTSMGSSVLPAVSTKTSAVP